MSRRKRPAPAKEIRPLANNTTSSEFTAPWPHQWNEPLTAEDRADLDVLAAAAARGFHLSVRCLDCDHWLSAPSSIRQQRGPKCQARAVAR